MRITLCLAGDVELVLLHGSDRFLGTVAHEDSVDPLRVSELILLRQHAILPVLMSSLDQYLCLLHSVLDFAVRRACHPRFTVFRYHDSVPDGHPELWVDFDNLKRMIRAVFWALERIRIRSFSPG
jgi:hypothetical protein